MIEFLDSLVKEFFSLHNRKVPSGILKYLQLYLEPSRDIEINPNDVLNMIKQYKININLGEFDKTELKIIYILCKLKTISRERPKLTLQSKIPLRKIALGIVDPVKYTNSIQETEILQMIHHNSTLYSKFKDISEGSSMAHLHFLKTVKDEVREYEISVLNIKEDDILHFFIRVRPFFKRFSLFNQINNHFIETKNPFNFLRVYHRNFLKKDDSLLYKVILNCTKQLNENLNQWLRKGEFTDYGKEFFITKNDQAFWISYNIEREMLPFFISKDIAQKILYIGKASNLIKQVKFHFDTNSPIQTYSNNSSMTDQCIENAHECPNEKNLQFRTYLNEIQEKMSVSPFIDALDPKFSTLVQNRLTFIDCYIKNIFVKGCNILEHLNFCKESFFLGRNDFIEHLFYYMKEISKSNFGKRSYSYILDTAIQSSFGKNNIFSHNLDMCVLKDDDFSLFYKLSFPINIIIEKDIIMIFLSIFKFLWKVKRVEHFLRRLKDFKNISENNINVLNKWYLFLQRIFFYFSYEVIEREFSILLSISERDSFVIDELRHGLKRLLKNVITHLFQENNKGKELMDQFLNSLEQECHNFRKHQTTFNDEHIRTICLNLFEILPFSLENTTLQNIAVFC